MPSRPGATRAVWVMVMAGAGTMTTTVVQTVVQTVVPTVVGAADVDHALPPGFGHYDEAGCGCRGAGGAPGWAMLIVPLLVARRRSTIGS